MFKTSLMVSVFVYLYIASFLRELFSEIYLVCFSECKKSLIAHVLFSIFLSLGNGVNRIEILDDTVKVNITSTSLQHLA